MDVTQADETISFFLSFLQCLHESPASSEQESECWGLGESWQPFSRNRFIRTSSQIVSTVNDADLQVKKTKGPVCWGPAVKYPRIVRPHCHHSPVTETSKEMESMYNMVCQENPMETLRNQGATMAILQKGCDQRDYYHACLSSPFWPPLSDLWRKHCTCIAMLEKHTLIGGRTMTTPLMRYTCNCYANILL